MAETMERRREKRMQYNWPVWFAANFEGELTQGQMVNISSGGAAFTCYSDKCPHGGQKITTRFSVPLYDEDNSFNMENFTRDGYICRIDAMSPYIRKVAIQFAEPLPFKPSEKDRKANTADETLEADKLTENEAKAMAASPE